jgi:CTP-dependent riboflavin kinase
MTTYRPENILKSAKVEYLCITSDMFSIIIEGRNMSGGGNSHGTYFVSERGGTSALAAI